ncbi:hypothetical protein [Shimia sp. MMG029]|uniref:hypothetical protein n=1 Tax=Shimia sp. MMG029 TaxID=3021978 RepID=UPI0022FDDF6D|nr:hypothetical protein [Shimia sp. MMG029]MDA5556182.1 hypothetical protein [Shimia sp. MMG029]
MQITTMDQARDTEFLRNLKNYCSNVEEYNPETKKFERIRPCRWLDWLTDEYRDLRETITDENGNEVFLDMEVFEVPSIFFWFRDFCKRVPSNIEPRLRPESEGRVIAMATILRARDPEGTRHF